MTGTLFLIVIGALLAAAVLSRPNRYLFGHARRRKIVWDPQPYLGEFVPAETPADRLMRENRTKLKLLLRKVEQDR